MMLTNLADIARAAGVPVVEEPGWRERSNGPFNGVRSIIVHHTAGPLGSDFPSRNVLINGRTGLRGMLAQLGMTRSGAVHVIGAGLAYHAGVVTDSGMYGNSWAIGIECENNGVGESWSLTLYRNLVQLCAALCKAYNIPASRVMGHKEVAAPLGRKIDPFGIDMTVLRANVNRQLTSPTPLPTPDEDDMAGLYDKFEFTSPDGSKHAYTYADMIGNLFAMMFYGSSTEPWAGDSGVSLLKTLQPGIEGVRHSGPVAAWAQMASDAARGSVTQLNALAEVLRTGVPTEVTLRLEDLDVIVTRLREALPAGVTIDQIESSVRRVFRSAGVESPS